MYRITGKNRIYCKKKGGPLSDPPGDRTKLFCFLGILNLDTQILGDFLDGLQ